ncbi:universal stress protein [Baekduia soli]|uniref:Universal stress protein n=1 Tax=Baekduia soli TaxID=496014 RepID=A0A5B8U9W1_9ACTN|nr:universal stress protein [Baekduia soli]QEC49825.1 universal stress protein [Baekduia soli]
MTEPVVVAVSEARTAHDAVTLGVTMARLLDAPLVLAAVAVTPPAPAATVVPGWSPAITDAADHVDRLHGELDRLAATLPADVRPGVRVLAAPTAVAGLWEACDLEHAGLLVLGESHLGPVLRTLRGDVALGAVRHGGCAVLVARPAGDGLAVGPPKTIGVAWDRSPEAAEALAVATDLAVRAGALLRILYVAPMIGAGDHELAVVTAAAAERVPAQEVLMAGDPGQRLIEAGDDLDLLVAGSRRTGPLSRVALGSVGAALTHHARCPVLVVPRGARVPAAA